MSNSIRFNSVDDLPPNHRVKVRERLAELKFARPATKPKLPANVTDLRRRDYKQEYLDSLKHAGLPAPEREQRFDDNRFWRLDFCWRDSDGNIKLAVEYEGMAFDSNESRHTSRKGYQKDLEKYAAVAKAKIYLIRITFEQVKDGKALEWTETALRELLEI